MAKKILKIVGIVLLVVIVIVGGLFGYLTLTEFKPAETEYAEVTDFGAQVPNPAVGDSVTILSWNVGYAGLGSGSDSFMDGGKDVTSADEETTYAYRNGICNTMSGVGKSDIYMLQEVDSNSSRTYHEDQRLSFSKTSDADDLNYTYALNYSCKFVPFPLPPIGQVNSGLMTTTAYKIESAQRISLPCPFDWPVRTANLKRCLLANYIPIEGTGKYLVMVDLHLEAYDDGEGKIAQTKQLKEFIQQEYEKGNYVIAGGDFNQEFPGALDAYPNNHSDLWAPGNLDESMIPDGWSFAYDLTTPSCRLLNQPYNPDDTENTQYYVIDGFILSPNVKLETVKNIDAGFENSDHNPVQLKVTLN